MGRESDFRIREEVRITKRANEKHKFFYVEEYKKVIKWILWFFPYSEMEWVPITHRNYFGEFTITKFKTVDEAKSFIERYEKYNGKLQTNISKDVTDEDNNSMS